MEFLTEFASNVAYRIDIFSFFFYFFTLHLIVTHHPPSTERRFNTTHTDIYIHKDARVGWSAIKALNVGVGLRYDTDQSVDHRYERINKTLTHHIFNLIILLYLFKDILYDTAGKVVHLVLADMPTRFLTM